MFIMVLRAILIVAAAGLLAAAIFILAKWIAIFLVIIASLGALYLGLRIAIKRRRPNSTG